MVVLRFSRPPIRVTVTISETGEITVTIDRNLAS
jgi:hypothetical protein